MRGGAVVEVVGGGGRGSGSRGMAAEALFTGYLQGCWWGLAAGSGSGLGCGAAAAATTKNKLFIFLL